MERPAGSTEGPILSFLAHAKPFDVLYLLYDPSVAESGAVPVLAKQLADAHPNLTIQLPFVDIEDPRLYYDLYREMRAVCKAAFDKHGASADYNVFLSPGTPQMHAVWVLLSKTDFPATAWQSSDKAGRPKAEVVNIPFDFEFEVLTRAAELDAHLEPPPDGLVGASYAFRKVLRLARQAAASDYPVLITGETGTGKEEVARFIHAASRRRLLPFKRANCGAFPANLVESTLFGHVRGAFTGAIRNHIGLFAAAQGGTLFLDEIAELPLEAQPSLLHVLQDNHFTRVGDNHEQTVDVRIIAATHRPIDKMQAEGTFREDLYYRLDVIRILVPPLRERREDIPDLVEHFVRKANKRRNELGKPPMSLSIGSRKLLASYDWPGNVRQLENHINRLDASSENRRVDRQTTKDMLLESQATTRAAANAKDLSLDFRLDDGFDAIKERVEKQIVQRALEVAGTQKAAAKLLGFPKAQNIQYYLGKHSMSAKDAPATPISHSPAHKAPVNHMQRTSNANTHDRNST
jgi:DNA-binding NtrC family response regulator